MIEQFYLIGFLTGTTSPGQNGPGSMDKKGYFTIP